MGRDIGGTPFVGVVGGIFSELKDISPIAGKCFAKVGKDLVQGPLGICGGEDLLEAVVEDAFTAGVVIRRVACHFGIYIDRDLHAVAVTQILHQSILDHKSLVQNRILVGPGNEFSRL